MNTKWIADRDRSHDGVFFIVWQKEESVRGRYQVPSARDPPSACLLTGHPQTSCTKASRPWEGVCAQREGLQPNLPAGQLGLHGPQPPPPPPSLCSSTAQDAVSEASGSRTRSQDPSMCFSETEEAGSKPRCGRALRRNPACETHLGGRWALPPSKLPPGAALGKGRQTRSSQGWEVLEEPLVLRASGASADTRLADPGDSGQPTSSPRKQERRPQGSSPGPLLSKAANHLAPGSESVLFH